MSRKASAGNDVHALGKPRTFAFVEGLGNKNGIRAGFFGSLR